MDGRDADDLVVLHKDLAVVHTSQQFLSEWLAGMGLELKPSKTRITHTLVPHEGQVGFNFLGYEVRQYPVGKTHSKQGFKTIIKPSKEAQIRHSRRIKEVIKSYKAASQSALINRLNPIIRGWANYFLNVCSKATYWSQRMGYHPTVTSTVAKLLKKQAGRCNHCGLYFFANDRMEVHHVDKDPTNYRRSNLALLHRHCHDQVHTMYV